VANIQSGNYCQPRCAEPWTEVIFTDPAEGKAQVPHHLAVSTAITADASSTAAVMLVCHATSRPEWIKAHSRSGRYLHAQVIVSPLVRLTNASDPPLEDVGTPEGILNSLGSYITYVLGNLLQFLLSSSVH
jgi:hypothetical protein